MNTQHNQQLGTMVAQYKQLAVRIAFALVIVALIASGLWTSQSHTIGEPVPSVVVAVERGDTLWDLACQYGPAGVDPRRTVCDMRRANGLVSPVIHPGDVLRIPQQ
jgi:hypothetical protein